MIIPHLSIVMITFAEFAAKPFVQRACANPYAPASVLTFFFGTNFLDGQEVEEMKAGVPLKTMTSIWYGKQDAEYDAMCRKAFTEMVRAAGSGKFAQNPAWNETVDGVMSQIILCDQLARNCFRGTEEAFAYDSKSLSLTLQLASSMNAAPEDRQQRGEIYPPYVSFMLLPLIHSENIQHHEMCLKLIEDVQNQFRSEGNAEELIAFFDFQKKFTRDHTTVLDRFGRYPHRNQKLRRVNTPEEKAWLEDVENLPGWAKSQG
jgi:uncharacterized protein (DUF924 family)